MSTPQKRIAFHTLGCKLNFSETATISRDFISCLLYTSPSPRD